MEAKRRYFGTFRQPQPHEGLGNVRPSWGPLLQPGCAQAEQDMDNWGQGAGWLQLGHGVWALGGEQGTWEQFLFPSPEMIQWYLIHHGAALVTRACCDHSRLQHKSVPSLGAPPSDVLLMLSWWWQRGDQTVWKTEQCQYCDYPGSSQGLSGSHGRTQQELNPLRLVCSQGQILAQCSLDSLVCLRMLRMGSTPRLWILHEMPESELQSFLLKNWGKMLLFPPNFQ